MSEAKPNTLEAQKEILFENLRIIWNELSPDFKNEIKGELKDEFRKLVESLVTKFKKDGINLLQDLHKEALDIKAAMDVSAAKTLQESIDFIVKLAERLDTSGEHADIIEGIRMLGSKDVIKMIEDLNTAIKEKKKGNKEIIIRADKLIGAIVTIMTGIVTLVVMLMNTFG